MVQKTEKESSSFEIEESKIDDKDLETKNEEVLSEQQKIITQKPTVQEEALSASELQQKIQQMKENRLVEIVKNEAIQSTLNQAVKGIESDVVNSLDQINDDVQIKILVRDSSDNEDSSKFKEIFSYQIDQSVFKDKQITKAAEQQQIKAKQEEITKMKQKMEALKIEKKVEVVSAPKPPVLPVVETPKLAEVEVEVDTKSAKEAEMKKKIDIDSAILKTLEKVKEQEKLIQSAE